MRIVRIAFLAGLLAIASLGMTTSGVAAYGHADGPLAQIEFSGNCNNPGFFFCQIVGLGGIWLWIEIDSGADAFSGPADFSGAGCDHDRAGSGGAGSIRGETTWWWSATPQGPPAALDPNLDPNGYYNLNFGFETLSFEVTQGHYSAHPAPAVAIEWQTAP